MATNDLLGDLILQYALHGFGDWKTGTPEEVQRRARTCLRNNIFESDGELRYGIGKSSEPKFVPMPKYGYRTNIEQCFFLPKKMGTTGAEAWMFVLFVLVTGTKGLAFRFEPAGDEGSRHNYPHMQFCRQIVGHDSNPIGIPDWVPERDPAFPLPSSDPLMLFLSMLISVHGRKGGIEDVITKIFQEANQAFKTRKYFTALRDMLD